MATPTNQPMPTSGVVSDIFKVTRSVGGFMQNAMVNVRKLYLRQIFTGSGANQSEVKEPNAMTRLGPTGVNNWAIYDGAGSQANLVANGQGMYTYAGNWNQWFTLVFKVERFKESTLQVMGANADEENDWAIVGGTGEFAMARGIIKRKVYSKEDNTLTQELTIDFFCYMTTVVPARAPTKSGPWGGNGGNLNQMEGKSQRLLSVEINHGGVVNGIRFSYIDEDGRIRTAGIWGQFMTSTPNKTETINFGPFEFVKQITGAAGPINSNAVYVSHFQIVTNHKTYGPFGNWESNSPFIYTVPEDEVVVGFYAYIQDYVRRIGVYTI